VDPVTLDALREYFPDGKFARRVQPLPEHGCIYMRNAKAASSTILLWLHRIHTGDHDFDPGNIYRDHGLPTAGDVGVETVVRMLAGEAFRFSFVRDPIRRCESTYLDRIADTSRKHAWRGRVQEALGLPEDPGHVPTFDQFVAALEAQAPIDLDPHWRPQHLNLMHGLVELDYVGRLETFSEDLERVRELTGMPEVPLKVRNARTTVPDSLFDGRPDLLRRVRDVYARDFEIYGYDAPDA
jgi:Sulfotransferase family